MSKLKTTAKKAAKKTMTKKKVKAPAKKKTLGKKK